MKKLFAILAVLMAFSLIFTACGSPAPIEEPAAPAEEPAAPAEEPAAPEEPAEKPTLVVWYKKEFTQATLDLIQQWADEFAAEKNINVDLTFVTMADAPTMYVAAIEAGTTPDVAFVPFWGPPRYFVMGALEDVTDIATELGEANDGWLPASEEAVLFDGKYYGVPFANTTEPLYMRTDVMEQLGYTDRPQTFAELEEFAKAATELGNGEYYGWGVNYNRSDDGHLGVQMLLWNFGSQTTAEDGQTITFNSPETLAGCEYAARMYSEGYAPPGAIGWTDGSNNEGWLAGQIAMTQNGPSINYAINQPDAPEGLKDVTQMYDWPTGPTGVSTSLAEAFSWVIFKNDDPVKVDLAKDWIRYLFEPERYDKVAESSWGQEGPAHNRGLNNPYMQQEMFSGLLKAIEKSRVQGWPGPYTPAAADIASEYVLTDMMVSVVADGVSCEDAIAAATTKIEEIYARYK